MLRTNVRCRRPAQIADWHADYVVEHFELPKTRLADHLIPRRHKGAFSPFWRRCKKGKKHVASHDVHAVEAQNRDVAAVHFQCTRSYLDTRLDIISRAA